MIKKLGKDIYYYIINNKEYMFYKEIFKYIQLDEITQESPNKIEKICFVIPPMFAYSGGHTSILRLGTYLSGLGYEVYYVSYTNQNINEMKRNATLNLKNYKGEIINNSSLEHFNTDVYVATSWQTVYYIKHLKGYKMYFVQDYEPYFYKYGEKYLLTKKTYELGLHMVSLGKWNKSIIEQNCNVKNKIDYIEFPYERTEYKLIDRDFHKYKHKKEINIAAYVKFDEKRAPYLIQYILENIKKQFDEKNIKLNIKYFGADKNQKFINGVNLGKLNKEQLFELYANSDFGVVASLSNISLVPFEMIATKLPVIEFEEGTFKYFFEENCAILTTFNWQDMYNKLLYYIDNPDYLEKITENAYRNVSHLSWENSARQFQEILNEIIN